MATSLSNETSTASLVELTHSNQLSGSTMSGTSNFQNLQKLGNQDSKMGYSSSQLSNSQQSLNVASSSNYSFSASQAYHKNKTGFGSGIDSGISSAASSYTASTSNLISNSSGLGYPFLYPNSIFSGLGQTSAASQYNYQNCSGVVGNSSMQSQTNAQSAQSNRRGGKKKAPATQPQNPETRLFFNLRRRDAQQQNNKTGGGGSSHYYKPKNPPTVSEWFKKLSVEERVNTLSTIYPHLIETFLTMHQRINEKGESYFALRERDRSYLDYKNSYNNPQNYQLLQYHNFPNMLSSSNDSDTQTFDQHFYQRVQNETEIYTIKMNERDKFAAEQEILKQVRLTYYFDNLDTLTVTEDLVQDSDLFFKLMAYATNNSAFQSPCQYFFDTKNQQNIIEYPSWFKPKSFHSFATWIIVALEENLWAHYNYDNNANLGTAKVNELSSLFREKTDRGAQDVDLIELSKFWHEMQDADKKQLINTLKVNSIKEVEQFELNLHQSGTSFQTKSSKSGQAKGMHYSVQVKERKEIPEKSNSQLQTEQELSFYIDISQRQCYEHEMMSQLVYTKFGNTHHRQIIISKTFLDLIKKKYKDDLMENLLLEESIKQNKGSSQGQTKKKKKKSANQNQQSTVTQIDKLGLSLNSDSHNTTLDYSNEEAQGLKNMKVPKQSKKIRNSNEVSVSDKQVSNNLSSATEQSQTISNNLVQTNVTQRGKKKKNSNINNQITKQHNHEQDNQGNISINQDSHSCDEQQIKSNNKKQLDIDTDVKSQSIGQKSQSTFCDTTAHQSNNSNSNSSATITSNNTPNNNTAQNILLLQSSKSLDLNSFHKTNQNNSQKLSQKSTSKVESKNYQILQQNQTESERRNSKNEKRNKLGNTMSQHSQYNPDNIIFSEDDRQSKKIIHIKDSLLTSDSESETMEKIRYYVQEVTNELINKVCLQLSTECDNSKSSVRENENNHEKQNQNTIEHHQQPEYFKLAAQMNNQTLNPRKKSYQKKNQNKGGSRKQSNQLQVETQLQHDYTQQHYNTNNNYNSNQQQQHQQSDKRKFSFNNSKKCFKDDKKFSEDFAENISNNSYHKSQVSGGYPTQINHNSDPIHQQFENGDKKKKDIGEQNDSQKYNSKPQRRGFGIHLKQQDQSDEIRKNPPQSSKHQSSQSFFSQNSNQDNDTTQAWAKGTAKQPETVIVANNKQQNNTNQKKQNNQHQSQLSTQQQQNDQKDKQQVKENNNNQNKKTQSVQQKKIDSNMQSDTLSVQDDKSVNDGQKNKKKRNRKKNKVNDIDLMNNFMKSLQATQDEVKSNVDSKSTINNQQTYKKRASETNYQQQQQQQQLSQSSSYQLKKQTTVSDTQSEKVTSYQNKNVSNNNEAITTPAYRNNSNDQQSNAQSNGNNIDNTKTTSLQYKQRNYNKPPQHPHSNTHSETSSVKNFHVNQKSKDINIQDKNENQTEVQQQDMKQQQDTNQQQQKTNNQAQNYHHKPYYAKQQYNNQHGEHKYQQNNTYRHKNSYQNGNSNYNNGNRNPGRFQKHQSQNQKILETKNEDLESVNSNVADCISDKSSKSMNEKVLAQDNLSKNQYSNAKISINYLKLQGQEMDLASNTDYTGTNTAADTSIENIANQQEENKEQSIAIQDQLETNDSHIQISLTDSIDAKNLFKNNAFAYTIQQFSNKLIESTMQQTLQQIQKTATIPPQLASPQSQASSQALFTPQYPNTNAAVFNQQQAINTPSNFDLNDKNNAYNSSYQSFQNTPQKSHLIGHSKNVHKLPNLPLSQQISSNNQDQNIPSFRTPPQISKKNSSQYNNYSNNNTYRKSNGQANNIPHQHNTQNNNNFNQHNQQQQIINNNFQQYQQNTYNQYQQMNAPLQHFQQPNTYAQKDFYHQPITKSNSSYIPQQVPMHNQMMQEPQFIHQYSDPSLMYYPDQQIYMQPNHLQDTYNQRQQDNVFQYVEKQMPVQQHHINNNMNIAQPISFYPTNQVPMPNFNPIGIIPPNESINFNFQKRQPQQQQYFDQGQDIIMQIFNTIKFNQQSLSPIPQCISSPPPLVDVSAQNSIDGLQLPQKFDSFAHMNSETQFYEQFDKEIQNYIQSVQDTLNRLKPERDYVYNKILQITREVFVGQHPSLQLFGSLVTGLALESSDMDLAVTGLYIEDRYAVVCELNKLADALRDWNVLESFKSIETASIPVIKMKVDLYKLREKEMSLNGYSDFDQRVIPEDLRYLSLDITFDDSQSNQLMNQVTPNIYQQDFISQLNMTKTHLGLQSCSLVQYFIANYQYLKEVSILLKRFLAINNFNSPYYGGISSYSTVILLVAYMNYFDLKGQHNMTPSRLLMGFLDFYGNFFNASTWGVILPPDWRIVRLQHSDIGSIKLVEQYYKKQLPHQRNSIEVPVCLQQSQEPHFERGLISIKQHYRSQFLINSNTRGSRSVFT